MKQKMFYLSDRVVKKLKVLSFISERSQSSIVEDSLENYLFGMQNDLSEDSDTADKIEHLLKEGGNGV